MKNSASLPFDKIWNNVITGILTTVESECDVQFKQNASLCCWVNNDTYKNNIESYYHELREKVKERCYKENSSENFLDYRKIAAVLCETFIVYKPFGFNIANADKFARDKSESLNGDQKNLWLVNNLLINYKAAYLIGLAYVYLMLIEDLYQSEDLTAQKELIGNHQLFRYPKGKDNDPFDVDVILELARIDQGKEKINLLLLAYLYYQVDMFNRLAIKQISPV